MEKNSSGGEINLLNYVAITVKKRKIFLSILILFIVAGLIKFLAIPQAYKVTEIIQLPLIPKIKEDNLIQASNFKARIEEGVYDHRIKKDLDSVTSFPSLKAEVLEGEEIIKINAFTAKDGIDSAVKVLNSLFSQLKEDVQPIIQRNIGEIEEKTKILESSIEAIKPEKESINKQIELYLKQMEQKQKTTEFLESQLKTVETTLISLLEDVTSKQSKDAIKAEEAMYKYSSNTLLNDLRVEKKELLEALSRVKDDSQNLEAKIEALKINRSNLDKEADTKKIMIAYLQKNRDSFIPIKVIQPPQVNIVNLRAVKLKLIGKYFIFGLIFGLFVVLFLDFYQKNRDKILGRDET